VITNYTAEVLRLVIFIPDYRAFAGANRISTACVLDLILNVVACNYSCKNVPDTLHIAFHVIGVDTLQPDFIGIHDISVGASVVINGSIRPTGDIIFDIHDIDIRALRRDA
jgi:hypothetical protein